MVIFSSSIRDLCQAQSDADWILVLSNLLSDPPREDLLVYLAGVLEDDASTLFRVAGALEAVEGLTILDAGWRARFRLCMPKWFSRLEAAGDFPALWCGIRRYGSMVLAWEETQCLWDLLLSKERNLTVRTCAAQTLSEILCHPPRLPADLGYLGDPILALVDELLALPEQSRGAHQRVLLMESIILLAVLGDARVLERAQTFSAQMSEHSWRVFRFFAERLLSNSLESKPLLSQVLDCGNDLQRSVSDVVNT